MRMQRVNREAIQQNPKIENGEVDLYKTTILITFVSLFVMWLLTALIAAVLDIKAYEFWLVMIMIGEALFGNKIIGLLLRILRK